MLGFLLADSSWRMGARGNSMFVAIHISRRELSWG